MGAPRLQSHLHQRQLAPCLQRAVVRHGGLAPRHRLVVHRHLLFLLVLQQEALDPALRRLGPSHGDAQIPLVDLPQPDLLVDDPQRLGVLGGDDHASCVAVDAVAQRGSEGVLPAGVPLPLLIEVRLDVVDEGVHLLRLVSVDHQPRPLVDQQQVLVLVHDVHLRLEQRQEKILLRRLVKELVVDV